MQALGRALPASRRSAKACRRPQLELLLAALPKSTIACTRDRMIMLLCYFGALTTFELLDLDIEHLEFVDDVLVLHGVSRRGEPRVVGRGSGSMCPVRAVEDWLAISHLQSGPLIRGIGGGALGGGTSVGDIQPKRYTQAALWIQLRNWFRAAKLPLSGMTVLSFRFGFLLDAYDAGVRLSDLADHLGVQQVRTIIRTVRRLHHPLRPDDEAPRRRV